MNNSLLGQLQRCYDMSKNKCNEKLRSHFEVQHEYYPTHSGNGIPKVAVA